MSARGRRLAGAALVSALLGLLAPLAPAQRVQDGAAGSGWAALQDGSIVLFRHAEAPGTGDPPSFKLGDCSTQRNLSAQGREQARRIGQAFRTRGVAVGAVLTSQWCRTRETAELAFGAMTREDASFNSFFGASSNEPRQTAAALATLSRWRGPGVLVVVTHQVNVTALTGVVPASGEAVVLRPDGSGVAAVGRLAP